MKDVSTRSAGTQPAPKARADGLVVQELMDEILVYDLKRHRSHCLNRTAALVWRHCDGSSSVTELAGRLHEELGTPIEEEAIWLALNRLSRAHLLQERVHHPSTRDRATRRTMLRRWTAVGGMALVSSIAVPGVAMAGSAIPIQCIQNCCGCKNKTPACDCSNDNSCKCCFLPGGSTVCSNNCGDDCHNQGGTCFQFDNNTCP